ncbi:MAG: SdpI family protein [Propionibacteriaceae bacterium]|nr:SdpI family protein [Propionibacteriaceae bacterium]
MEDSVMAWLGLILTWTQCLVFLLVCRSGARPGSTPNPYAGIRLESTTRSPAAWQAAHRVGLKHARRLAASILLPSAIVMVFFPQAPTSVTVAEWVLAGVSLAWILVASSAASRAALATEP